MMDAAIEKESFEKRNPQASAAATASSPAAAAR